MESQSIAGASNGEPDHSESSLNHSSAQSESESQSEAITAIGVDTDSSFYDRQYRHYENPNENVKESLDNDDNDNDLIQSQISDDAIETVALEYDMGITKETKLCSRWCRRSFCVCAFQCCGRTCGTHRCCKRPTEEIGDGLEDKPSNEELLSIAFISFLTFTICQAVAAYFANSQAMMGDSMAMGVDAFTYGFNLMAERMKHKTHVSIPCLNMNTLNIPQMQMQIQHDERWNQRAKRKQTLVLELVPPIISVTTLVLVTAFILHESVSVLVLELDEHRDSDVNQNQHQRAQPNVIIMFAFSCLNLVVDAVNIMFFSKADHAFGYDTFDDGDELNQVGTNGHGNGNGHGYDHDRDRDRDDDRDCDHELEHTDGLETGSRSRSRTTSSDTQTASPSPSKSKQTLTPSKGKGAKKQIADSLKLIMRETKRRKGGAYAHVGAHDQEHFDDDAGHDDDLRNGNYDTAQHIELTRSFSPTDHENHHEDQHHHDHDFSEFSIDEFDDDDDGDENHGVPSSPLRIQSNYSMDEEEAEAKSESESESEHQLAEYEYRGQKGKANLNMVRLR
jgi:hypothetical protein